MQSHRNTTRSQVAIPVSLALIFSALTGFGADISYSGNGVNDRWDNAGNWNGGTIPNDSTSGAAFNQEGTHVILDATTSGLCRGFMVGMYGKTNTATIEGGTLNCTWLDVGRSDQNGGNGTLTVSEGQITIANYLNIPTQFSTQVDPNNLGHGRLNLLGGTIGVPTLHIGNGQTGANGGVGILHITNGTLILNGDKTTQIQDYITEGKITTMAPNTFQVDFDDTNAGKTTITAGVIVYGEYADRPYPPDGLHACHTVDTLSWKATNGADSLQIYFGTTSNPPLVATLAGNITSYQLPTLNPETTYYWRVDATQGPTTNSGPVWSFSTRAANECPDIAPPWNDYCAFLQQEIQGKNMGFLRVTKPIMWADSCLPGTSKKTKRLASRTLFTTTCAAVALAW